MLCLRVEEGDWCEKKLNRQTRLSKIYPQSSWEERSIS